MFLAEPADSERGETGAHWQRSGQTADRVAGRLPEGQGLPGPDRSGGFQTQRWYGNKQIKEKHSALMLQVNNFAGEQRLDALLSLPLEEAAAPSANLETLVFGGIFSFYALTSS